MKIKSIKANNIFAFSNFNLDIANQRVTTIVGPNGSGKTNLIRLFSLINTALDYADRLSMGMDSNRCLSELNAYLELCNKSTPDNSSLKVELEVEFTTDTEKEQIIYFIQSAVLSRSFPNSTGYASDENREKKNYLANLITEKITAAQLEPLFNGLLCIEHSGLPGSHWQISYRFIVDNDTFDWAKDFNVGIRPISSITNGLSQYQQKDIVKALFGFTPENEDIPSGISKKPFTLQQLLPGKNENTILKITDHDYSLEPNRCFRKTTGLQSQDNTKTFYFWTILKPLISGSMITVAETLRDANKKSRPLPIGEYIISQLNERDVDFEPYNLPLRLFNLKNGTVSERKRFDKIRNTFNDLLPKWQLDLRFEILPKPQRIQYNSTPYPPKLGLAFKDQLPTTYINDPSAEENQLCRITITVREENTSFELPITSAGAGIGEALILAEAIADCDDKLVILDEPGMNLHPSLQETIRELIEEDENIKGQFLLITHSPYLLFLKQKKELKCLIRFSKEKGVTVANHYRDLNDSALEKRIIREFSLSADARSLLFANAAIILEGETELGALPRLFAKSKTTRKPADSSLAFFSVGGDQNFTPILALLIALGIPYAIICDGNAFGPECSQHIFKQLNHAGGGNPELKEFIETKLQAKPTCDKEPLYTFEEAREVGRKNNIFTLATGWTRKNSDCHDDKESFEAFLEKIAPGKLCEAENSEGRSKVRQGFFIADAIDCPKEIEDLYENILISLQIINGKDTLED